MKTQNLRQSMMAICLFILLLVTYNVATAQKLSIKGNLTVENKSTLEQCTVQILDMDTQECISFKAVKFFKYKLEYNKQYIVIISHPGLQPKSIFFNTECKTDKGLTYSFDCNLLKAEINDDVVCQAGGVFFDKKDKEFTYYYHK